MRRDLTDLRPDRTTPTLAADVRQPPRLLLLMLLMAAGPLVSYAATALGPLLTAEMHISPARFGLFATASFLSATLFSRLLASTSDRLSSRIQLVAVFGFAVLALLLLAAARNVWWALAAAVVSGPAHALSNPLTNRIVATRILPTLRGRWMGIKQSGVQCSQAFAGLALPAAALLIGWRVSILLLVGVVLAILAWGLRRIGQEAVPVPVQVTRRSEPDKALGENAVVLRFAGYAFFSGAGLQATNIYVPLFAHDRLHFDALTAGWTVALAGGVGLCARIFWGRILEAGGRAGVLLCWLSVASIIGILCIILAQIAGAASLLWMGVVIHGATAIGSNVIVMAGVLRRVPAVRSASTSAKVGTGMYLGFSLGPLLLSLPLSATGSYLIGWCLVAACYALALSIILSMRRWA